jgi:transcriptional regulator with XRE-family HTH domain
VSRRPILAREQPHLHRLGRLLSTTRRALSLTQEQVALEAGMHWTSLQRLELGTRRTRRSTLRRIAAVFVLHSPRLGPVETLLEDFVQAAGPALAEESAYAERVARRRALREDRDWQRALEKRRRDLAESLKRWERTEYGRSLSEQQRLERWQEAASWLQEAFAEAREKRKELGDLRGR